MLFVYLRKTTRWSRLAWNFKTFRGVRRIHCSIHLLVARVAKLLDVKALKYTGLKWHRFWWKRSKWWWWWWWCLSERLLLAENEPILDMNACDDTLARSSRSDVPRTAGSSPSLPVDISCLLETSNRHFEDGETSNRHFEDGRDAAHERLLSVKERRMSEGPTSRALRSVARSPPWAL